MGRDLSFGAFLLSMCACLVGCTDFVKFGRLSPDAGFDAAIDECSTGADDCAPEAVCADTASGFDCTCSNGSTDDGHGSSGCECASPIAAATAFDGRQITVVPATFVHDATWLRGAPNLVRVGEELVFVESTSACPSGLRSTRLGPGIDGGARNVVDACLAKPPSSNAIADVHAGITASGTRIGCTVSALPESRVHCGAFSADGTFSSAQDLGAYHDVIAFPSRASQPHEVAYRAFDANGPSPADSIVVESLGVPVASISLGVGSFVEQFVLQAGASRIALRVSGTSAPAATELVAADATHAYTFAWLPSYVATSTASLSAKSLVSSIPTRVFLGDDSLYTVDVDTNGYRCPVRVLDPTSTGTTTVVDAIPHGSEALVVVERGSSSAKSLSVLRLDSEARLLEAPVTIGSGANVRLRGALLEGHLFWVLYSESIAEDWSVKLVGLRLPNASVETCDYTDEDADGRVDEDFAYSEVAGTRHVITSALPIPVHAAESPSGTVAVAYIVGMGESTDEVRVNTYTNGLASPTPAFAAVTQYQTSDSNRMLWSGNRFVLTGRTRSYDCVGPCTTYSAEITSTSAFARSASPLFSGGGMSGGTVVADGRLMILHDQNRDIVLRRFSTAGVPDVLPDSTLFTLPSGAAMRSAQMIDGGERIFGALDFDPGNGINDHYLFASDRRGNLVAGPTTLPPTFLGAETYSFSRGGPALFYLGSRLYFAVHTGGAFPKLHLLRIDPDDLSVMSEDLTLSNSSDYGPYPVTDGDQLYLISYPSMTDKFPSVSRFDSSLQLVQGATVTLDGSPSPANLVTYPFGLALARGALVGAINYSDTEVIARFGCP